VEFEPDIGNLCSASCDCIATHAANLATHVAAMSAVQGAGIVPISGIEPIPKLSPPAAALGTRLSSAHTFQQDEYNLMLMSQSPRPFDASRIFVLQKNAAEKAMRS
jgi:hypothetical protein